MVQAAQLKEHEVVLDLGYGIGWDVQLAAKQCKFILGADFDEALLDVAKQEIKRIFKQEKRTNTGFTNFDIQASQDE